jgi:hypothetical protein
MPAAFSGPAIQTASLPISIDSGSAASSIARWWNAGGQAVCLLAGILLLAWALRFYDIGKPSFWIDELIVSEQSTGMGLAHQRLPAERFLQTAHAATALRGAPPWWNIWTSLDEDNQPPLYFIVLRAWRGIFGEGDVPTRGFSAVISVFAILLLYFAAEALHGQTAALWACLIMALAGPQIEFGQEAGGYAMAMAMGLAMSLALVRIEKLGATPVRLGVLGLCALGALLTHYCAGGAVLACIIYALIRLRGRTRWRAAAVLLVAVIAFLAVWGPFLVGQWRLSQGRVPPASDQNLSAALFRWLELPVHLFVNGEIEPAAIAIWSAVLFILPFLVLRRRPDLLLWGLWLVATTLPLALIDGFYSTDLLGTVRFVLLAAPAAYAIVAAVFAEQPGYRRHVVAMMLALCCTLTIPDAYVRFKEDWKGFAAYVASCCKPGDVMVLYRKDESDVIPNAIYLALSHYLPQADRNGSFEVPIVVVHGPVPYKLLQRIDTGHRVWFVNADMQSVASDVFPGAKISEERHFPMMPYAATIARIEPVPLGIPFLR